MIDPVQRSAVQLCPFVKTGIMHREFQKFLRPDGLGIDYTKLENFDARAVLNKELDKERPEVIQRLRNAIRTRSRGELDYALFESNRLNIEQIEPELVNQARELFNALKHK